MDYDNCRNLPAMFFDQAERRGDRPFLWAKRDGRYQRDELDSGARAMSRRLARGLAALGVRRGDRVGLVAENRPEWVVADLAIMSAGGDHRAGLHDQHRRRPPPHLRQQRRALGHRLEAGAGERGCWRRQARSRACAPSWRSSRLLGQASTVELLSWDEVMAHGGDDVGNDAGAIVADLAPDDIACLIYTSGTGGVPKGVMTSHGNILANCRGAYRLLEILGLGDEVFLSFLPLSHAYEHTARPDVPDLDRRADLFRRRRRERSPSTCSKCGRRS